MRKKLFVFLLSLIILSIIIVSISVFYFYPKNKNTAAAHNMPSKLVKVMDIKESPYRKSISTQGTLLYSQSSNLIAQQPGIVTGIYFKNGDRVKKSQLLIKTDDSTLKQDMDSKYAKYQQFKDIYTRDLALYKQQVGYLSKSVLNKAKQDYLAALADYNSAKLSVEQTSIKAPFDGIVGALSSDVNIGSQVNTNDTLVNIVNPNYIEVEYSFNQKYFDEFKIGQLVNIYLGSSNKKISATVDYISPKVDSVSNSISVRALIDLTSRNKAQLVGGMMVLVKQALPKVKSIILAPGISIIADAAGFHVFVVKQGKSVQTPVVLGESIGDNTVIESGLKPKDKLVISGIQNLSNGSLVKII
jgi:membrane fusion protein, multidrug efflux system